MQIGNSVYVWWYTGLGGLGGWALFLLLSIAAMAYVYVDSSNRGIRAAGWRLGTVLPLVLFLPTILYRFTVSAQPIDPQASEWFLVLGVLGAIISIASAVGYAVSYWGVTPAPPRPVIQQAPVVAPPPVSGSRPTSAPRVVPPRPARETLSAWLYDESTSRQHPLYVGDTRIGRSPDQDIVLDHSTVSREHALVRAEENTFKLWDRASKSGTFVNGRRIGAAVLLYPGDTVELGEVKLTFMTPQR
jgi:hypothetical protein